jgi:hypothetical protein
MRPDTLGDFARHLTHHRVHRHYMDGNVGMLNPARIEQGHHQIDVVMRSSDVERVPFCQQSQTARTALTYSRIHGPAGV